MSSFESAPVPPPAPSGSGAGPGRHGSPADSSAPLPPGTSSPTDNTVRGHGPPPEEEVRYGIRVAAAYAWRLIVLAVAVYLVFVVLAELTLVAVAVFVGLVISALLRPLVDLVARALPRGLAVVVALLATILAFGGVFTFVADSVAGQFGSLTTQFISGLSDIERQGPGKVR